MSSKISNNLEELCLKITKLRPAKIIYCHGVFDLLHIGHIRYLNQAKTLGDFLVVTITPDNFVDKGPGRPAFTEQLRLEAIAALDCVDFVAINESPTAEPTLQLLKPDVYAKGAEFKNLEDASGKIQAESAVAKKLGIDLVFIEDIVFSSSNLINRFLSKFSSESQEYLQQLKNRFTLDDVLSAFDQLKTLRVLVVGDMILDEYIYCKSLGAASKDPILALHEQSRSLFAGGSAAVANHVAQHVAHVTLCSVIGDDGQDEFIRKNLDSKINFLPTVKTNSLTLCKKRIVDGYSFQKLIEVYSMDPSPLPMPKQIELLQNIEKTIASVDLIIAADFGHGCITDKLVDYLCTSAPFLAVNTQANAANRGYHTISRYSRADFISLATHEIELEYRNKNMSTVEMMLDLQQKLKAQTVLVTEGRQGCAVLTSEIFQRAPSFTSNVVDRVGAGDALFAVTALAAQQKIHPDVIAFIGNIAGSLAVETIGNAKAVSCGAIQKYIKAILK